MGERAVRVVVCAGLLAGVVAGCTEATGPGDGGVETAVHLQVRHEQGVLLLTQNVVQEVTMDALYEGTVTADADGCLRLDGPSPVTVVWPMGYSLEREGGELRITDASGAPVGVLGGDFSLAGGEVAELLDAMGFTAEDRALAEARCPGDYWVVAGSGAGS